MMDLSSRYDMWSVGQLLVPLVAGGLGAVLVLYQPRHLGKVVLLYAITCLAVGLSPHWLGPAATPAGGFREVLLETKVAFFVGAAVLLAAGGAAPRDGRSEGPPPA